MCISPVRRFYRHPSSALKLIGVNRGLVDELRASSEQMCVRGDVGGLKRAEVNTLVPSCKEGPSKRLVAVVGPSVNDLDGREVISVAARHPANEAKSKRRLIIVRVESPEQPRTIRNRVCHGLILIGVSRLDNPPGPRGCPTASNRLRSSIQGDCDRIEVIVK
jgi:hypothetical protein